MTEKARQKTAIVIGAGVGGVSTAARLAKAGFKVTVLEKNEFTGGRCSLIHRDGYRFDQGPSLLLLPRLFHQTFEELGTSIEEEGVELRKCEPNYNIWFGDGERFRLSTDLATMKAEVEKWEGKDGYSRYLAFLQESHRHYELSVDEVLLKNFTSLFSMLRWSFLQHLLALHPFESIWTRASKYFWTERLRRVFTFGSMYMGMSPFDAPGTYSLLQYTELAEGIWYPVGGFHRVVEALVEVGKRLGVTYRLSTAVSKIVLSSDGSTATGVELESGESLEADVVINNSDLVYAYTTLLPSSPYAESLSQRPASCSSISFYWGLTQKVPQLEAHNIFLADDYKESFDSIFKKHLIPSQPSFYVNVPSRVDASAAPEGRDTIVILVPVGHLLPSSSNTDQNINGSSNASVSNYEDLQKAAPTQQPGLKPSEHQDWPAMIALARKTILSTIKSRTGADIGPLITTEVTNDPNSWKARFNLDRGAILGLSHSFFNVLCFRPSTKARRPGTLDGAVGGGTFGTITQVLEDAVGGHERRHVQRLYMVGASAHPGTGVPICLAGGRLVAEQVLEDYDVEIPWRGSDVRTVKQHLDRIDKPVWLDSWQQWLLVVVGIALLPWLYVLWSAKAHV
ncbi:ATP-binding cassette transporter CGR1 [Vermiconidia calcicola]|uniref:ATP-binding cassette transporter CGR1 n=1 Tax=Vermiconidia calcicola TaxID=1690605 RepID=A0ACC3MFP2_9PEZI|nr:ATP-binding cassette transporter CGR1 [Vermiconidia calcicola]